MRGAVIEKFCSSITCSESFECNLYVEMSAFVE